MAVINTNQGYRWAPGERLRLGQCVEPGILYIPIPVLVSSGPAAPVDNIDAITLRAPTLEYAVPIDNQPSTGDLSEEWHSDSFGVLINGNLPTIETNVPLHVRSRRTSVVAFSGGRSGSGTVYRICPTRRAIRGDVITYNEIALNRVTNVYVANRLVPWGSVWCKSGANTSVGLVIGTDQVTFDVTPNDWFPIPGFMGFALNNGTNQQAQVRCNPATDLYFKVLRW